MSLEERSVWVFALVAVGTYVAYVVIVLGRAGGGVALENVTYVRTMVWTIGIAIVLTIVGRILAAISKPDETGTPDVRDKEINRFGEYVGGVVVSVAMIVPLVLALRDADTFWIANAIYMAFIVEAIVASAVKIVAYRVGPWR